jgi:predicted nucleotidyltransferase
MLEVATVNELKTHQSLLKSAKKKINSFVSPTKIYLVGSQAHGDAKPNSDWDLLIVSEKELSLNEEIELAAKINIEHHSFKENPLFNLHIFSAKEWNESIAQKNLFCLNLKEGAIQL